MNKVVYTTAMALYGGVGESPTAEEVLQKMEEASNRIQDASLTVKYFDASGKLTRTEVKKFKKPNKYRTEIVYTPEENILTFSDGERNWLYNPDEGVATVSEIKKTGATLPDIGGLAHFSCVDIRENYIVEFKGVEKLDGRETLILHLKPKPGKGQVPAHSLYSSSGGGGGVRWSYSVWSTAERIVEARIQFGSGDVPDGDDVDTYAFWTVPETEEIPTGYTKLGVDVNTFSVLFSESDSRTITGYGQKRAVTKLDTFEGGIVFPTEVNSYAPAGNIIERTVYTDIQFNTGLTDEQFTFTLPDGTVVLDEMAFSKRDEIIAHYEAQVKSNPDNPALRYALLSLYQRGYYPRNRNVLMHLKKLLELHPDRPNLYSRLGYAYLEVSRAEESLAAFQKALQLNADITFQSRLSYQFPNPLAQAYEMLGKRQKAIAQYKQALETETSSTQAIQQAWSKNQAIQGLVALYRDEGKLEELVAEYQRALEANFDAFYLHRLMGDAYLALENQEKAVQEYRKVLNLMPAAFLALENQEKAVQEYHKVLNLMPAAFPFSLLALYRLEPKLQKLGLGDELAAFYQKRLERFPGAAGYRTHLALIGIYARSGDIQKLATAYENFLKSVSCAPMVTERLENIQRRVARAQLVERIEKALENDPQNALLYRFLGVLHSSRFGKPADTAKALRMYQRAAELAPEDATAQMALAKGYIQQKAYSEAALAYQRAVELQPQQPYYLAQLAYVYNRMGEHQQGLQIGRKLVSEAPDDFATHGVLGTIYLNAERYEDAVAEYKTAIDLTGEGEDKKFFHKGLAKAYEALENYTEADALYDKLGFQAYKLVDIYRQRGDFDKLLAYGLNLLKTGSQTWTIREIVGAFFQRGQVTKLVAALENEIERDPNNPEFYKALGQVYSHWHKPKALRWSELSIFRSQKPERATSAEVAESIGLKPGEAVKLEYKFQEGDIITYNIQARMISSVILQGNKKEAHVEERGLRTNIATDVSTDGIISLITTEMRESRYTLFDGWEMWGDLSFGKPFKLFETFGFSYSKRKRDGTIIESTAPSKSKDTQAGFTSSRAWKLPDTPVKIGDSWTQTDESQKGNLETTFTLAGFEKAKGYNCARIEGKITGTFRGPEGQNVNIEKGEYVRLFAIDEGLIAEAETSFQTSIQIPFGGKASFIIEMIMQIADRKKLTPIELKRAKEELKQVEAGQAHLAKGEKDAAKTAFKRFLNEHSDSIWRPGVEKLIEEIDAKPKKPKYELALSKTHLAKSNAIEMYEKAVELAPDDGDAYWGLGGLYGQRGMEEKAISAYERAIKLMPDSTYLYSTLAKAYANRGKTSEALRLADDLAKRVFYEASSYSELGDVYSAAKAYDKAIESYKQALELEPGASQYKRQLAEAYEQAGKTEEAEKLREEI